jgi:hypothetical protein
MELSNGIVHERCADQKLDEYSEVSPNGNDNSSPDAYNSECASPADSAALCGDDASRDDAIGKQVRAAGESP